MREHTAVGPPFWKRRQVGMFWRFLAAMFASSCLGTLVFVGAMTAWEELHLRQAFSSGTVQRRMDAGFARALPLLRQAAATPSLCATVLRTLSHDIFGEDILRRDSANSLAQLLRADRFAITYARGGQVVCAYPRPAGTAGTVLQSVTDPAAVQPDRLSAEIRLYDTWMALRRNPAPWNTILLFVAVLNLSCAFALVPLLVRRIRRAQAIAREWRNGRIHARIEDDRQDEFGDLANSFDRLADAIADVIRVKQELAAADERNRLAQDLHDTAKQRAFALNLQLTALKGAQLPETAGTITATSLVLVRQLQNDLASIIQRLSASTIAESGIRKLVDDEMHALLANSGIGWTVDIPDAIAVALQRVPQVAQQVFLIAMEAVANALKHAGAGQIRVSLAAHAGGGVLAVQDDGCGFDVASAGIRGMGLANMRLRARSLPDGHLSITSSAAAGTSVHVRFGV